jgi:hypothetical protein
MFDFANSLELTEELKINDIYELFKTDSSDFNKMFLSNIQKYSNTKQLISHYIKNDIYNIYSSFNDIQSNLNRIINEENQEIFYSENETYILGSSKIILFLSLIQKNNQLLMNLLNSTKLYISNFYKNNNKESCIKSKIDLFLNELINPSSHFQRSYSRRSTNDITNSSICVNLENKNKQQNLDLNLQKKDVILRSFTPKFKNAEENNITQKNSQSIHNSNVNDNISRKSLDSTFTLQKMNFVQVDEGENLKKKNKFSMDYSSSSSSEKSKRFFYKKNKSQSNKFKVKVKDSLFKKNRKFSANSMDDKSVQNERIKILAEILDTINIMFKKGKINSEQKINIKQIIISHPKIIFDKYYKDFENINDNNDKLKMIEKFLLEELKGL